MPDSLGKTVLERLRSRDSSAVADAIPSLIEAVETGLEPPQKTYRAHLTQFLLETGRTHPSMAAQLSPLLGTIDEHIFDEERIARLFIAVAVHEPEHIARWVPHVLSTAHTPSIIDHGRGWGLARAAATDAVALTETLPKIEPGAASTAVSASAIEQLGQVGLVAPQLVELQLPALLTLAGESGDDRRAAALRAVGRTLGVAATGGDRYGLASTHTATTAVEVAATALTAESAVVIEAAAETLGSIGVAPPQPAAPAMETLVDGLETTPAPARETVLENLETITERRPLPAAAIAPLRQVLAVAPSDEQRQALRLLGRVAETEGVDVAITEAIVTGFREGTHHTRRGAVTACERLLSTWTDPPTALRELLYDATEDSHRWVRDDAYSALAAGPASTRTEQTLQTAAQTASHVQAALSAARALDLPAVTTTAVEQFAAALPLSQDEDEGDQREIDWKRYASALTTVADDRPIHLAPHVDTLCSLLETRTAGGEAIAAMLHNVASAVPTAIDGETDRLRRYCTTHPEQPHTGAVLAALLATDWYDSDCVAQVARRGPTGRLAPAAPAIADRQPAHVFEMLAALETRFLHDTTHEENEWWLHELPALAEATQLVHQPLVDLSERLLRAQDEDWVRWDGAKTLAAVGRPRPTSLRLAEAAMLDGLDDWNSNVPLWTLRAVRRLPNDQIRQSPPVQSFRGHPYGNIRRAGYASRAGPADESLTANRWATAIRAGESHARSVATVFRDVSPAERTTAIEVACTGLRSPEPAVRERAVEGLTAVVSGEPETASDALIALLGEGTPAEQALAVYTAGEIAAGETDANLDRLRACLETGLTASPLAVRRWAVRSLGRLATTAPLVTATALPDVIAALESDDACVRAYAAWTLAELAWTRPAAARPAAQAIVSALATADNNVTSHLVRALQALPPDAVAAVSEAPRLLTTVLEASEPPLADAVGAAIAVLAQAAPESLEPYVHQLAANMDVDGVAAAVARVAAVAPAAVSDTIDAVIDAQNGLARREALAWCGADEYPAALESPLAAGTTSLAVERESIIVYLTRATTQTQRRAALQAAMTGGNSTDVLHGLLQGLCEAAEHTEATTRQRAVVSIADAVELCDSSLEPVAEQLLATLLARTRDADADVRSQAFRTLTYVIPTVEATRIRDARAAIITAGIEALDDTNAWVYRHAATVLGLLPRDVQSETNLVQQLIAECRDATPIPPGVNLALAETAQTAGEWETVTELLAQQLTAESLRVRQTAYRGLAKVAERRRTAGQPVGTLPSEPVEVIRTQLVAHTDAEFPVIAEAAQAAVEYFESQ
ncbi:hypothetical protein [Halosegnis longus]|uniref:hypothetical protein n=1 Tax=Halosegnis longus TaxID=2216012 RepID=UPI00096A867C|nr:MULTISPECIES: hypothetical protein [Halobacteriales]